MTTTTDTPTLRLYRRPTGGLGDPPRHVEDPEKPHYALCGEYTSPMLIAGHYRAGSSVEGICGNCVRGVAKRGLTTREVEGWKATGGTWVPVRITCQRGQPKRNGPLHRKSTFRHLGDWWDLYVSEDGTRYLLPGRI